MHLSQIDNITLIQCNITLTQCTTRTPNPSWLGLLFSLMWVATVHPLLTSEIQWQFCFSSLKSLLLPNSPLMFVSDLTHTPPQRLLITAQPRHTCVLLNTVLLTSSSQPKCGFYITLQNRFYDYFYSFKRILTFKREHVEVHIFTFGKVNLNFLLKITNHCIWEPSSSLKQSWEHLFCHGGIKRHNAILEHSIEEGLK